MARTSSGVNSDDAVNSTRRTEPGRDTRNEANQCTANTSPLVRLVPGDTECDGHDSRAERNTHEFLKTNRNELEFHNREEEERRT